jgi:hypothetical protein
MSFSFYTPIHKGIRNEIAEVCVLAGKTNFIDGSEACFFKEKFLSLLDILKSHSEHEHAFIHPLLSKNDRAKWDEIEGQ